MAKKVLGRGLGALLEDMEIGDENSIREIKLIEIEPNSLQPRKKFDIEKLEVLAQSIKNHGIIQPIIVKRQETGFYKIIAGERRWRAAKIAGLKSIPVIIKEYERKQIMEVALIENLQREDLNAIEEARAYQNLIEEFDLTQEAISERIGKSRSAIANSLRLLKLPDEISNLLVEGRLTGGHARALLSIDNIEEQKEIASKIEKYDLSVREVESIVKKIISEKKEKQTNKKQQTISHIYKDIQNKLSQSLGTKVKIYPGKRKSKIEIEYYSNDDLERLLEILDIDNF